MGYVRRRAFRDGRDGGAVGGAAHAGQGVSRGLLERCWPDSPTPDLGRLVVAVGTPADLTLFTEFGVMPVSGHWHMRHRVDRYLEQRAPGGRLDRARRPRAHAGPRGGGVEAARARRHRARPRRAARVLRPHPQLPRDRRRGRRPRHGALLGERPRRDRARRGASTPRTWSRSCSPRSTGWRRCRSRRPSASTARPPRGGSWTASAGWASGCTGRPGSCRRCRCRASTATCPPARSDCCSAVLQLGHGTSDL